MPTKISRHLVIDASIAHASGGEEAMLKDIHLIEAAKTTDQTVIALDETVRKLFVAAGQRVGEMRNIVWVNPDKVEEQPISWLENGAKLEKKRLLGFGGKTNK